jgi:hypothetical protein
METMIVAGQTAAFAKPSRQNEDAYYRQQAPRTRYSFPRLDVLVMLAVTVLATAGILATA